MPLTGRRPISSICTDSSEEDPLSGTNNLMEQDPLEDYGPPLKKEKIEDEEIVVKEELVDCDLVTKIEIVNDMEQLIFQFNR